MGSWHLWSGYVPAVSVFRRSMGRLHLVRMGCESGGAAGCGHGGPGAVRPIVHASDRGRARRIVVSVLVVGSLLVAVVVSLAVGAERPYPGVALGSGLLLELERAVAVWAIVLLALVVGDQALRGRLPDEISGRGVRYVPQEQFEVLAGEAGGLGGEIAERLNALERADAELRQRLDRT